MSDTNLTFDRGAAPHVFGGQPSFGAQTRLELAPAAEPAIKLARRARGITADFRQDLDMAFKRALGGVAGFASQPGRSQRLFHALDGKSGNERDRDDHIAMQDTLSWMAGAPEARGLSAGMATSWKPVRYWPAVNPAGKEPVDLPDQLPHACACAISQDLSGLAFSADLGFRDLFVVAQIGLMSVFLLRVQSKGVSLEDEGAVARLCDALECGTPNFDLGAWPVKTTMLHNGRPLSAEAV